MNMPLQYQDNQHELFSATLQKRICPDYECGTGYFQCIVNSKTGNKTLKAQVLTSAT